MEIKARNVNDALATAIALLLENGVRSTSRNGDVLVLHEPVLTTYASPRERVLFCAPRDANPFFHLMESLWMLNGQQDLAWPLYFMSNFGNYSDDGVTLHGAYGYRWRKWFGYDQLATLGHELMTNPSSRRCVLSMWDGDINKDLNVAIAGGKDVPCNTHAYFDARGGKLNMTVCCRSNDAIWGAYGANAVHFSVLLEFMAFYAMLPVGEYRQFSNNLHVYTDVFNTAKLEEIAQEASAADLYSQGSARPYPLVDSLITRWQNDLQMFMEDPTRSSADFSDPFFAEVAQPMYLAYKQRKEKLGTGMEFVERIHADDWRIACTQWIERREAKKQNATSV